MRNILTVLILFVLTLTTSSVFAEKFDESKRTERFGLSFYDGRPLYFAYLYGKPTVYGAVEYRFKTVRVCTGDVLEDLGSFDATSGGVHPPSIGGGLQGWCFYARADDGQLTLICAGQYDNIVNKNPDHWVSQALQNFDPGIHAGDLAVETYDEIAPDAQAWARRGIMLAVLLLALSAGLNKFRELTSGGASTSEKSAKTGDSPAAPVKEAKPKVKRKIDASEYLDLEHESSYRLRTPRELREERARLDRENIDRQSEMSAEEALREAYISGDYWGKSFSDEVRENNRQLYEAFDKMDAFNRRLLIQKFDEMSFMQEAAALRSYNKDVYGFADDWTGGNPFDGDDEDGAPPF